MKKVAITGIMLIVTVAMGLIYATVHALTSEQKMGGTVTVRTMQPLSAHVDQPATRIFYKGAINPTVKVETGSTTQSQLVNPQAR